MLTSASEKVALMLMAAGSSSRLGQPKQLVETSFSDKAPQSLLHQQIALLANISLPIQTQAYCVVGFQAQVMKKHIANSPLSSKVILVDSNRWQEGLSNSIAAGVMSLDKDISAVVILLVDQWQLSSTDIIDLIQQWQKSPDCIYIANQDKSIGPPVIFPRHYFNELTSLTGDDGAKSVIRNNIANVKKIHMPHAFIDLDTPDQLAALRKAQ